MGWFLSFSLLILGAIVQEYSLFVAAGLFAIAGSIEFLSSRKGDDK